MKTIVTKALAALTAIMIPVAAIPHFNCICPNGESRQASIVFVSSASGCSCGGACCGAGGSSGGCCQPSKAVVSRKSCCAAHVENFKQPKSDSEALLPSGCQRTLADQQPLSVSEGKATLVSDNLLAALDAFPVLAALPMPATTGQDEWQAYCLAPPTNLVVVLQRLLI